MGWPACINIARFACQQALLWTLPGTGIRGVVMSEAEQALALIKRGVEELLPEAELIEKYLTIH